jgi:Ca2+-binding EF-hand superfamily protein
VNKAIHGTPHIVYEAGKIMMTAHDRELIEALFQAADDNDDGYVDARDIENVCAIHTGACAVCKERGTKPILYSMNEKMTLEYLLEMNDLKP